MDFQDPQLRARHTAKMRLIRQPVQTPRAVAVLLALVALLTGHLEWIQSGHTHADGGHTEHHHHGHWGAHHHHGEDAHADGGSHWTFAALQQEEPSEPSETPTGEESSGSSLCLTSTLLLTLAVDSSESQATLPRATGEPTPEPALGALLSSRHDPASLRGPPSV